MFTDCADYNEWKTGRRSTGLMMAASLFFLKFGLALGAAAIGWILAAYSFVEKAATQSPEAVKGIVLLNSIYPAIFALIGVAAMLFYPLSDKRMLEIETDLIERRKQEGNVSVEE
jgi:GPH family glycoside/pentoside/hexuronide:cation symporter